MIEGKEERSECVPTWNTREKLREIKENRDKRSNAGGKFALSLSLSLSLSPSFVNARSHDNRIRFGWLKSLAPANERNADIKSVMR